MNSDELFKEIAETIVELDEEKALQFAYESISKKFDLLEVIEKGFGEGIRKVGDLWDEGELFLPELMRGAQIMQKAVDVLTPELQAQNVNREVTGRVVLATIEGDIHSIGKTIVGTMLRANGFEVKDLGTDVKAEKIVDEAITFGANIIGLSSLLTTTMVNQKKVLMLLEKKDLRDKIKVILGGAPVTTSWVAECKADGYAENAVEAVKLAKLLCK